MGSFFLIGLVIVTFAAIFFTLIQTNEVKLKINSEEISDSIELFALLNIENEKLVELIKESQLTNDETKLKEFINTQFKQFPDKWIYYFETPQERRKEFEVLGEVGYTFNKIQRILIPISKEKNIVFVIAEVSYNQKEIRVTL